MNKFEQLIEYVINDDEAKARELFHDIVVEKSRSIYESMMEEELEEADDQEMDDDAEAMEEGMHDMGGDQADDLIDDIETEESGVSMGEAEDDDMDMDDHHADVGGDEELEDRVVDLEDKLDELMAEFESLMGDGAEAGDDMGDEEMDMEVDMDMDTPDMDAEEVVDDEFETEGVYENVDLKAAPKPVTSEEGGVNKKSTVAANSGARGAVAKPVSMTGDTAQGRTAPTAKDMGSTTQPNVKPATKPHLAQAAGVNTKTPFPKQ
jgi:hypothetical protein